MKTFTEKDNAFVYELEGEGVNDKIGHRLFAAKLLSEKNFLLRFKIITDISMILDCGRKFF